MKIRPIAAADETGVVTLLIEGFPARDAAYWKAAFRRLEEQVVPSGHLQFGLAMEEAGQLVGVLLVIWTPAEALPPGHIRANLSSWYVKPEFRSFAAMLLAKATRGDSVTYLNVSAAEHTIEICKALGFKKYSSGQAVGIPILAHGIQQESVVPFQPRVSGLSPELEAVMVAHVNLGCMGYVGRIDGRSSPFLFVRRRVQGIVPAAQLIFCENMDAFARCARGLGRHLLLKGLPCVICDTMGPLQHQPSRYFDGKTPKYYKGPHEPRLGDLAFTEIPMFGL